MCSRAVAEKQTADGVSAKAHARLRTFDYDLRRRARDGGQQPIQATFASDEVQFPAGIRGDQFVVTLGNAQDSVDRLGPFESNFFVSDHGAKNFAERIAKGCGARKQGLCGVWIRAGEGQERGAPFARNDVRSLKETDEFFPREAPSGRAGVGGNVGEIESKASTE